jgi:hypothetical protein
MSEDAETMGQCRLARSGECAWLRQPSFGLASHLKNSLSITSRGELTAKEEIKLWETTLADGLEEWPNE